MKLTNKLYFLSKLNKWDKGLIALCIFHLLANTLWLVQNNGPYSREESINSIATLGWLSFHPLVGKLLINTCFCLLICSVYYLNRLLLTSNDVALLTAIVFSFSPMVYEASRFYLATIPFLALITATLILLTRRDPTRRDLAALLTVITLGILIGWSYLVYIIIPLVAFVAMNRQHYKKLALFGLCLFTTIVLVYSINPSSATGLITKWQVPGPEDPSGVNLSNISKYFVDLVNSQALFPSLLLILFGIKRTVNMEGFWIKLTLINVLFVYIFFTLILNKDKEYTLPILIGASVLAGLSIKVLKKVKSKLIKVALTSLLLVYYLITFVFSSFTAGPSYIFAKYYNPAELFVSITDVGEMSIIDTNSELVTKPEKSIWLNDEILATLKPKGSELTTALIIVDKQYLNYPSLEVTRRLNRIDNIKLVPVPRNELLTDDNYLEFIKDVDYLLVLEKSWNPPEVLNIKDYLHAKGLLFFHLADNLERIKEYNLLDGDLVAIYKYVK